MEQSNSDIISTFSENGNIFGIVYVITNTINGKMYIGKRLNKKLAYFDNYWGSGKLIKRAIAKYGKNNFQKEILCFSYTEEELNSQEKYYIKIYNTLRPCGYNIAIGGNGGNTIKGYTKEKKQIIIEKRKLSHKKTMLENRDHYKQIFREIAIKNRKNPNFGFKKGNIPHNLGKKMSEEYCNKLSVAHKGFNMPETTKEKISNALLGRKISEENKKILRERVSKKIICITTQIVYSSIKECYEQNKNNLKCCFNTFKKKLKNKETQLDNNIYHYL